MNKNRFQQSWATAIIVLGLLSSIVASLVGQVVFLLDSFKYAFLRLMISEAEVSANMYGWNTSYGKNYIELCEEMNQFVENNIIAKLHDTLGCFGIFGDVIRSCLVVCSLLGIFALVGTVLCTVQEEMLKKKDKRYKNYRI